MKSIFNTILVIILFAIGIIINPFLWFFSLFKTIDNKECYHEIRKFVKRKNNCDKYWKSSFNTESDFSIFSEALNQEFRLLGQTIAYSTKPKVKFFIYEYGGLYLDSKFIYECSECKSLWELSYPEYADRGYFKRINLNKKEIQKYLSTSTEFA